VNKSSVLLVIIMIKSYLGGGGGRGGEGDSNLNLDNLKAEMFDVENVLLRDLCTHGDLCRFLHLLLNLSNSKKIMFKTEK
jgi:hypothetical protein